MRRENTVYGATASLEARTQQLTTSSTETTPPVAVGSSGDGGEGNTPKDTSAPPSEAPKNWSEMTLDEQISYMESVEKRISEIQKMCSVIPEVGDICRYYDVERSYAESIFDRDDISWHEKERLVMVEMSLQNESGYPYSSYLRRVCEVGEHNGKYWVKLMGYYSKLRSHFDIFDPETGMSKVADLEGAVQELDKLLSDCHEIGFTQVDPIIAKMKGAIESDT